MARWAERLSRRERLLLGVAALVALVALYYELVVDPLVRQSLALQGRLQAVERLRAYVGEGWDAADLEARIAAAEAHLAELGRTPASGGVADILEFLDRAAAASGLRLVHVARAEREAAGPADRRAWEVVASGPFAAHRAFLRALEGMPGLREVAGIVAVAAEGDGGSGGNAAGGTASRPAGVFGTGAEVTYRLVLASEG